MATNQTKMNPVPEGFVPNKALGQNFLSNRSIIDAILEQAQIDGKRVLEIGPGTGALTEGLVARAGFVAAVEKDGRLCELLAERFGESLSLVHADVLDADIPALMGSEPWHAVGNLPYYATTPIVLRLLSLLPSSMTLMVQKEAADRFFAEAKDRVYGPVAVLTGCCYTAKVVVNAPRGCFTPEPEVAFSMRRKTLYNNLNKDARVLSALSALGCPADARAEALAPEQLLSVFEALA